MCIYLFDWFATNLKFSAAQRGIPKMNLFWRIKAVSDSRKIRYLSKQTLDLLQPLQKKVLFVAIHET